ncbi:MAG: hypothetical protein JSV49_00130 [Thermoplasmata archaeon]|nr:MAG: hypothetical protein JSV49_00130 [Thermoplasmata archaeon]
MEYRLAAKTKRRSRLKFIGLLILGILALIIFGNIVYSGFTERTTQLSAFSDNWNDISKFREDVERSYEAACVVSSPAMLSEIEKPEDTVFVAIGIERAYTTTEARAIYKFIQDGGRAIIADDYGYANSISEYYFSVTYLGHRLWDQEYEKNPQLVKIDVDPSSANQFYFDGNILLNDATALSAGTGEIAMSTNLSWVDENDDGLQNIEELPKEYPVVVKKELDEGAIIFVSDSSLFINDMWDRFDNAQFVLALIEHLIDKGGTVLFDESRHLREHPMDSGRQAAYEALVILTTDDQLRWLTAIITILILGLLIISYDDPRELRHIYNIGAFKIRELREPMLTYKDTERVRYMFLERVRIHLGLSLEEFRELTREELDELIGDRTLSEFALNLSGIYTTSELTHVFQRIKDWPLNPPSEDVTYQLSYD